MNRPLNPAQKAALAAGAAAFCAWGLWPPTRFGLFDSFLAYPNPSYVEWSALLIGWAVVAVVAGVSVLLLSGRR